MRFFLSWHGRQGKAGTHQAFSLLEMLVACAVLLVLVGLVSQIISMTSSSISASKRKLESVGETRMVLDRIGVDLAARLRRTDVPSALTKASGNDSLAFYGEVDSYDGTRRISFVSYRINTTTYQLERAVIATNWTGTSAFNFSSAAALPTVSDSDYDVLGPGILRLEICFLKTDGSLSNKQPKADLSDVAGIVVAVAALDPSSRKILSSAQLKTLSEALTDPGEGQMPAAAWQTNLNKGDFAAGVPRQTAYSVRFFQRSFYIR
ncbi:MAG: prepilin-type N-terminal cleavage/methylation domain-containing protein [Chthoniobacteraceae bacterium]